MHARQKLRLVLDHAHGKTYAALAVEFGLSVGRVEQIDTATRAVLGLRRFDPAYVVGLCIQRHSSPYVERNTPEGFHRVLIEERHEDNRLLKYTGL